MPQKKSTTRMLNHRKQGDPQPAEGHLLENMRQQILTLLWRNEAMTVAALRRQLRQTIVFSEEADFDRKFERLLLTLQQLKVVETVTEGRKRLLRLAHHLDG